MRKSNHGWDIDDVLDDLTPQDLRAASDEVWLTISSHPADASCECPVIEALGALYASGYQLLKEE